MEEQAAGNGLEGQGKKKRQDDASLSGPLVFQSGLFDLLAWPVVANLAWAFVITAAVAPHVLTNWFLRSLRLPGGSRLSLASSDWLGWWECILLSLLGYAAPLLSSFMDGLLTPSFLLVTALAAALGVPLFENMLRHYAGNLTLDGRRIFSFSAPFWAIYPRLALLMASSVHPHLLPLAVLPLLRWFPANLRAPGVSFSFTGNVGEAALRLGAGTAVLQALPALSIFLLGVVGQNPENAEMLHWALVLIILPFLLGWWLRWIAANICMRRRPGEGCPVEDEQTENAAG